MAIGDGVMGVFDPSVHGGVMVYSAVDVSPVHGWGLVSTRIKAPDGKDVLLFPSLDGDTWAVNFETPSVMVQGPHITIAATVMMQSAEAPGDAWRRYDMSATRIIVSHDGSEPQTLLAGSLYNEIAHGPSMFRYNDALAYAEPSLLKAPHGYWLACQAHFGARPSETRIRLFNVVEDSLVVVGDFFTDRDLQYLRIFHRDKFAQLAAFAAPNLFEHGGKTYLMVTPMDGSFTYQGTAVFEVEDISRARLVRQWGILPKLVAWVPPAGVHEGAGCHTDQIVVSRLIDSRFTIVETGVRLPS